MKIKLLVVGAALLLFGGAMQSYAEESYNTKDSSRTEIQVSSSIDNKTEEDIKNSTEEETVFSSENKEVGADEINKTTSSESIVSSEETEVITISRLYFIGQTRSISGITSPYAVVNFEFQDGGKQSVVAGVDGQFQLDINSSAGTVVKIQAALEGSTSNLVSYTIPDISQLTVRDISYDHETKTFKLKTIPNGTVGIAGVAPYYGQGLFPADGEGNLELVSQVREGQTYNISVSNELASGNIIQYTIPYNTVSSSTENTEIETQSISNQQDSDKNQKLILPKTNTKNSIFLSIIGSIFILLLIVVYRKKPKLMK